MSESEKNKRLVYLMVPRKLAITYIATALCLFAGIVYSIQYANYVDRKSNHELCGVVVISNDLYKLYPPPTALGSQVVATTQRLQDAMVQLQKDYRCK